MLSDDLREIESVVRRLLADNVGPDGNVQVKAEGLEDLADLLAIDAQEAETLERLVRAVELQIANVATADGKVVRFADYRRRARGDAA